MKAESVPTTGSNADVDANWRLAASWLQRMQAAHAVGLVLTNTGPKPNTIMLAYVVVMTSV